MCSYIVSSAPAATAVQYHAIDSLNPAVRQAALQAAASVEDGLAKLRAGWAADDIMAAAHTGSGVCSGRSSRASRRSSAGGRRRSTWRGRASAAGGATEAATVLLLENLESLFGVRGGAAQRVVEEIHSVAAAGGEAAGDATNAEEVLEVGLPQPMPQQLLPACGHVPSASDGWQRSDIRLRRQRELSFRAACCAVFMFSCGHLLGHQACGLRSEAAGCFLEAVGGRAVPAV